jgi:hypothetical protein
MLTYAGQLGCSTESMLTYAGVCGRMLTYADVCSRMLTYADVCGAAGMLYREYAAQRYIESMRTRDRRMLSEFAGQRHTSLHTS